MKDYTHIIHDKVANSFIGRRFRLDGSGHVSRPRRRPLRRITDSLAAP
jgi:hypothetical protein